MASKPAFLATMKMVPKYVTEALQTLHIEFMWSGKKPKIKHTTLINEYSCGGLNDVDIKSYILSLKIS